MFIDFPVKFRGLSCQFSLKPIISIEQCHRHNIVTDTLAQHCRTHKQYNVVACDGVTHTKPHTTVSHTHNTVAPTHACNIVTYNIVTHTSVTHTTFSQTTVTPTHTQPFHISCYIIFTNNTPATGFVLWLLEKMICGEPADLGGGCRAKIQHIRMIYAWLVSPKIHLPFNLKNPQSQGKKPLEGTSSEFLGDSP